jgi:tRNA G10  N-methylase Trm11
VTEQAAARTATPVASPDGRLAFSAEKFDDVTHYLFRYPAKFHPPVARHLIEQFSQAGETVLDPFCGSGTLLVEASIAGRKSVGTDIDPVAILASRVKSSRLRPASFDETASRLLTNLKPYRRSDAEYERRQFEDYDDASLKAQLTRNQLALPDIPRMTHWFRRYVAFDLAVIKRSILLLRDVSAPVRDALLLCFASTVRRASNADPVPVSGLEVTAHMKKIDAKGRTINPFAIFETELRKARVAFEAFWKKAQPGTSGRALQADACRLTRKLKGSVAAVITSPPYHGAVDYYRRHTLETYWLDYASSLDERLELLPRYIGRAKVPQTHEYADTEAAAPYLLSWEKRMRREDPRRADALKHYALSMQKALTEIAQFLEPEAPAVFVVGNSRWKGDEIDTSELLSELAKTLFTVRDRYWYPIKNRYMSYSRHNGASIAQEHVLVLERKA